MPYVNDLEHDRELVKANPRQLPGNRRGQQAALSIKRSSDYNGYRSNTIYREVWT
jgi:hypothetical protein